MTTPKNAKPIKGWITTTDAAKRLGVTRQTTNRMAHSGVFSSLSTLGDKPLYVVKEAEVQKLIDARKAEEMVAEEAKKE